MSEDTPEMIGEITIKITEDEIMYDSELDLGNIIFFLEVVKDLIIKQALEKPD